MPHIDLVVIGAGPAGYVPAMRAAGLGRSVALVEQAETGGTCLNRGCIPTKTLVATAELLRASRNASRMGLSGSLELDFTAASKRKDMVVTRLRKGIEAGLAKLGVQTVRGRAAIGGPGLVLVDGVEIRCSNILVATGSSPAFPGPLRNMGFADSTGVLSWDSLPESMVIVGGGVIGCEFASIFSAFGVRVSIVEMLPGILPGVDSDVRRIVHSALVKSGVKIHVSSRAVSARRGEGTEGVVLEDGTEVAGSVLVVAAGRVPNTADLGLAGSGVAFTPKGITTDERMMTSVEGIYAAGDVTGRWQLAHAGSAQALLAVDSMFRPGHGSLAPDAMPGCIFTSPEVATVGPGEDEWRERGVPVRVEYSRYIANGRAVGLNETEGFVKLVARESDGVLVGVQIVGRDASSLVGEASLAVTLGIRASELGRVVHPHPTLSELFMEAGEAFGDGSIHG